MLNTNSFLETLDATQEIIDVDELGYMMRCVLLREWNIATWKTVHKDVVADQMIVYRKQEGAPLGLIWYLQWDAPESVALTAFIEAYTSIVEERRGVNLPSGKTGSDGYTLNDTINKVYIEQRDSTIIIMEDYQPYYLDNWLNKLHTTTVYNRLAKKVEGNSYPRIDKEPIMKNRWR